MTTASRKISVRPAIRMFSAISFGVFCRSRAFHQRDHAVEKRLAGIGGDLNLDLIGQNPRAAGDGAAVAARFADDRRAFAGDGRFVHGGDAFDHFAIAGDQCRRARRPRRRRARSCVAATVFVLLAVASGAWPCVSVLVLRSVSACALPRAFRHGFGEVGEQHGEPQPERDLEGEADVRDRRSRDP